MNIMKVLSSITITAILFMSSCDNSVDSPLNSVGGKLYTSNHIPAGNFTVVVEGKKFTTTDDGSFYFQNVQFPYDLIVEDSISYWCRMYKGLSISNPTIPLLNYTANYEATVSVTLPDSLFNIPDKYGKIVFTDGKFVNSYVNIGPGVKNAVLHVNPEGETRGNIIIITYMRNSDGEITSYENYGRSTEIRLTPGITYYYNFPMSQLSFNPGESSAQIHLTVPAGAASFDSYFFVSFCSASPKETWGDFIFFSSDKTDLSAVIPTGISGVFYPMVSITSYWDDGYSNENFMITDGSVNNLNLKKNLTLISPEEGTVNVNLNTVFNVDPGDGQGIYNFVMINLSRPGYYSIVKADNNLTLDEIKDFTFGSLNGNNIVWSTEKLGQFSSMDDLTRNFFNQQTSFITSSYRKSFTMAP